ncbi:MAG: hypothetical protein ACRCY6_04380 [Bacteroidales bacterium]
MNKKISLGLRVVLVLLIAVLSYALVQSILSPIRFKKERDQRYSRVIERLKDIRTLQRAYKSEFGRYTNGLDTLMNFYRHGQITVELQIGSLDDSLAVARKQVIRKREKVNVRDNVLPNLLIDSLPFIPFSGGCQFQMAAGTLLTSSKVSVPVFEALAHNDWILGDMDRQQVVNLNDERKKLEKYPGLKVGSLTEATNDAGNWE